MITFGKLHLNDNKYRPFEFSKRIIGHFNAGECEIAVVSGMPEGCGKSAYTNATIADIKGWRKCRDKDKVRMVWLDRVPNEEAWDSDWEATKPRILYTPKSWAKTFKSMLLEHQRDPTRGRDYAVHLDDAGTWLQAMSWNDPFVIAFMSYLPLARSNWGEVIMSTPVESWILKKLNTAKGLLHIDILKDEGSTNNPLQGHVWKPRVARAYMVQRYLGKTKNYYPIQFLDHFSAIMPDEFFNWYMPRRDRYTLLATEQMDRALAKRQERGMDISEDEEVLAQIKESLPESAGGTSPEKLKVVGMTLAERKEEIAEANDSASDWGEVIENV